MRMNAWVVQLVDGRVSGASGQAVERGEVFLAEGAWAGEFSADGLLRAEFRCGSGVVVQPEELVVVPPSHGLESVYLFQGAGGVWISNSFQCLVASVPAAAPARLQPLREAAAHVTKGKLAYPRLLYETDAGRLLRFAFDPVRVSRGGMITEHLSLVRSGGRFREYKDYRQHLSGTLANLLENARAIGRRQPYGRLVTTCSGGYDSAACAALAANASASLAVTVRTARGGASDSGKAVAESLGLPCLEFDRFGAKEEAILAGAKSPTVDVEHVREEHADFLASIYRGVDLYMSSFAPHLRSAVVLTGYHGDKVWVAGCPSGEEIKRGDASGTGLDEFRKRIGFVHVPVPFMGVSAASDIARISAADEMKPWREGGHYDRPIPRRIAEEAGVPRELFGQRKVAATVHLAGAQKARAAAFDALVSEYKRGLETAERWEE